MLMTPAILNFFFFLTSTYFHLRSFSTLLHFSAELLSKAQILQAKTHQDPEGIQTSILTANMLGFPLPTSLE